MFDLDKSKFACWAWQGHPYVVLKMLWKHIDSWTDLGQLTKKRCGAADCWGKHFHESRVCLASEQEALRVFLVPF